MKTLFTLIFFSFQFMLLGQGTTTSTIPTPEEPKGDFGLGVGIDYGGFGGRVTVRPAPAFALFGAGGYNLNGFGYNLGAAARLSPGKKTVPTLGLMYGYNAVIVVDGASQYNRTYYGPSISAGLEFRTKNPSNHWNLEIVLPFRPQAYTDDLNALKNNAAIQLKNEPWPITISVGYHFGFKR